MKVSVVIPVYNVENYIEECLESVINQTIDELEIIPIHDAGSDNSFEIVKRVAAADNNPKHKYVLLENEVNKGLAATRNVGIENASGEYIYFLDSDDKITLDAMETLYERAKKEELDAQIFCMDFLFETEELYEKFKNNPSKFKGEYPDKYSGRELFKRWMEVWDWIPVQPRYFYRREFLIENNLRYTPGMLHEDETFAFNVLMNAKAVRVTNDKFFIRRVREDSIMSGHMTMRNVEGCVIILDHISSFLDTITDKELISAVNFYSYKIFNDVVRKYKKVVEFDPNGMDYDKLPDTVKGSEKRLSIFHMVEAMGRYLQ